MTYAYIHKGASFSCFVEMATKALQKTGRTLQHTAATNCSALQSSNARTHTRVCVYVAVCCSQCVAVCFSVKQRGRPAALCRSNTHNSCVSLCMCVCVCVCVCVCLCLCVCEAAVCCSNTSNHTDTDTRAHTHTHTHTHTQTHMLYTCRYGVASISTLLKIIGLFCKRAL